MQQESPRYVIDRPAYNLPDFDREFDKKSRQFPVGEKVKKLFRYWTSYCTVNMNNVLFSHTNSSDKPLYYIQKHGDT